MEKQITAVEDLIIELTRLGFNFKLYSKEIKKAKDKEKYQIIESYRIGMITLEHIEPEDYYTNKYI